MSSPTPTTTSLRPGDRSGWVGHITHWSLAGLFGIGMSSLSLAMVGLMRPLFVLPVGLGVSYIAGRWITPGPSKQLTAVSSLILVALAASVLVIGITRPHEHFLATRDSGTYVSTAAWIANTGSLRIEAGSPLFEGVPVQYETLGFPAVFDDRSLTPQFLHIFPSTLALVGAIGPDLSVMHLLNPLIAVIGLLALFSLARDSMSDGYALLTTALITVSMPFLYFSRAPFTEPMAFAFAFGGLWVGNRAIRQRSLRLATGAGLLFGGLMLTRIDGVVVLLGLVAYRTLTQLRAVSSNRRQVDTGPSEVMDRMVAVAVVLFILAMVDGALFSPQYLADHGILIALVLGMILVVAVIGRLPFGHVFVTRQRPIANITAASVGVFLVYAWTIRPALESPTRSDIYGIAGLQRAAGVAIEPLRSYAELSVHWLVWYLGLPLVLAGLVSLVYLLRRVLLGEEVEIGLFIILMTTVIVPYVYRPSINPDHMWAMRRFVPVVLPALVTVAVLGVSRVLPDSGRWGRLLAVSVGVVLVAPVVATSGAAGLNPEFEGAGHDLMQACETLGEGSVLVFTGEAASIKSDALAPPLRGFCGIAVAAEDPDDPLGPVEMDDLASMAAARGSTLWIISDEPARQARTVTLIDQEYEYLELTLFEPPDEWLGLDLRIIATKVTG